MGPDRIVGVTCGASRDRAITAAEAGADYVAFGAFFPSMTKTATKHHADPELIRDWSETTVVPCCAIGGITQENCGPLVEAGADFLAVIGAIWSHPQGPARRGRRIQRGVRPLRPCFWSLTAVTVDEPAIFDLHRSLNLPGRALG